MSSIVDFKTCVIIPNWNGVDTLGACLDSLLSQSMATHIIVVDNGSVDNSIVFIQNGYPSVEIVRLLENRGYAGGVNAGLKRAMELNVIYAALFNNDATADKNWLKFLVHCLDEFKNVGIVAPKLLNGVGTRIDSTGEFYSIWGLPFPRGRGEAVSNNGEVVQSTYDDKTNIFGASGAASLYRIKMLQEIGLFDEDFFAYYEDVDLSFRAQLAGWKINYAPESIAYHQAGTTSVKIKGFTTYQTTKNLPWLLWKNVPTSLLIKILPRFLVAYSFFMFSAGARQQALPATYGYFRMLILLPKKTWQRWQIHKLRRVKSAYIWDIMTKDLPPNAHKLRLLFHPIKTMQAKS
jgi:GT2 family glycosyltransferase